MSFPLVAPVYVQRSITADIAQPEHTPLSTTLQSSREHIADVRNALQVFSLQLEEIARQHDLDKVDDAQAFHADFITRFQQTDWWGRHRKLSRHHLSQPDGIPDDVNLLDVLEYIADCTVAGLARSGQCYKITIDPDVLMRAFHNTCANLKSHVRPVSRDFHVRTIARQVLHILEDLFELEGGGGSLDQTRGPDFGLDSLDLTELRHRLEKEFDVEFESWELDLGTTVGQIARAIYAYDSP